MNESGNCCFAGPPVPAEARQLQLTRVNQSESAAYTIMLLITNDKIQSVPDIIGLKATICPHLHSSAFQAGDGGYYLWSLRGWREQFE
jgi:hypothetical protein